jgi:DtxR family Mn-dependent transcriptional regulator
VSERQPSSVAQDYLKAIWNAQEWSHEPVTATSLAQRFGVALSTVSATIARLARDGLVLHERYGDIELTPDGKRLALAMVRRHRLIETFLVEVLGYSWDEVHDEAEVLEHAVSDRFLDRIDERLGFPRRDPHGDLIPSAAGTFEPRRAHSLTEVEVGGRGRVARISDADPEVLRYFTSVGIGLDASLTVVDRRAYTGVTTIRLDQSREPVHLGDVAASAVWITADDDR